MNKISGTHTLRPVSLSPTAMAWDRGTILAAIGLTLGMFLLIPFLEALIRNRSDGIDLRTVHTIRIPPSTPPVVPERDQPAEGSSRPLPIPALAEPRHRVTPPNIPMEMELGMERLQGDFGLDFAVASGHPGIPAGDLFFQLGDLDQSPQSLVRFPPPYPPLARMRRLEGTVPLEFIVTTDGTVGRITVLTPRSHRILETAAVHAVRQWRFQPGTKDGVAVPVRIRQQLTFRLEEE